MCFMIYSLRQLDLIIPTQMHFLQSLIPKINIHFEVARELGPGAMQPRGEQHFVRKS